MDGVDAFAACFFLEEFYQLLSHAVNAAHGRNYPYFVSYAYFAILANVALEGAVFLSDVQLLVNRVVGIFERTGKISLEVVLVYPFARLETGLCMTDRVAILQNICTLGSIVDEHLVSCRSILQ